MGKMGDAANLGAVAIAAFIVWKLAGIKMPKLELPKFEFPTLPAPGEITGLPGPAQTPGVNIWNLFQNGARANGNGDVDGNNHELDSDLVETLERLTTREFVELPDMPTLEALGIKPPEYFQEKAEYHAARLEYHTERLQAHEERSAILIPALEAQLGALQANVESLSYMVKGHDAGGDIDMTRIDVGSRLRPI